MSYLLINKTAQAYTLFSEIFKSQYDDSFPILNELSNKKYKKPWMTPALLKSVKTKTKMHKKYLINPTIENKNSFNKFNNKFKIIMKQAEKLYYSNNIRDSKNSSSNMWKCINSLLNKNKTKSAITLNPTDPNDSKQNVNTSISNRFNNYFVNIGQEIANNIQTSNSKILIEDSLKDNAKNYSFQIYPTTPEEIKDIIANLKHKKSSGYDNINQNIVIESAEYIAEVLLIHPF